MHCRAARYEWEPFVVQSLVKFDIFTGVIPQKVPKMSPIEFGTLKNERFLLGKMENRKHPEVKTYKSKNYGWMVLL